MTLAGLTWQGAMTGRWIARISGTLLVLFVLTFLVGEGFPPLTRMTTREQFYALGFGSLFVGLVIAWFWERWPAQDMEQAHGRRNRKRQVRSSAIRR